MKKKSKKKYVDMENIWYLLYLLYCKKNAYIRWLYFLLMIGIKYAAEKIQWIAKAVAALDIG